MCLSNVNHTRNDLIWPQCPFIKRELKVNTGKRIKNIRKGSVNKRNCRLLVKLVDKIICGTYLEKSNSHRSIVPCLLDTFFGLEVTDRGKVLRIRRHS